jgi:predicted Rossmann fold flavoprotein
LKSQAVASLIVDGKIVKSFEGDVLLTDYGVSGNAIFYLSAYIPQNKKSKIVLSFLPDKTEQALCDFLRVKFKNVPYLGVDEALTGVINKLIGKAIVKTCAGVKADFKGAEVVARAVKNFSLDVVGTLGFDYAQVTKGGIPFSEVDAKSMQSKKAKGVYVVGEMLDVDGDCGGYNLQWAYSSAMVACDEVLAYENR